MSNLRLEKDMPSDKTMIKRESGQKSYPIWLAVNPKHPAVRHNIWTPALAEIQDKVYKEIHKIIDVSNIYIRNVVCDSRIVTNKLNWWGTEIAKEIELFRQIVLEYKPKILISFGSFPYEFLRRVYGIKPEKGPRHWSNSNLGLEFERLIEDFDINKTNLIPLLRRLVSSDKFMEGHDCLEKDYFHYVGIKLAEKIIENKENFDIWIE